MYTKTKQEILDYLNEKTAEYQFSKLSSLSANKVSTALNISRSLASQYLNELFKDTEVIKVNSRPVIFLGRVALEHTYEKRLVENSYHTMDDLFMVLNANKKNFEKAIGHDLALRDCINNIKKALHYPKNGLPIVLHGVRGSGKTFLANLIYEYCRDNQLLPRESKWVVLSCNDDHSERLIEKVFGTVQQDGHGEKVVINGAIDDSEKGLLLLDDIAYLNQNLQERFVHFLDTGDYQRVGDSTWHHSETRIIFVLNKMPEEIFSSHLFSRLAWIVEIPSLDERTIEEKKDMIVSFFKRESRKTQQTMLLSDYVVDALLVFDEDTSIVQLKNRIIETFSNAIIHKKDNAIEIRFQHLPFILKENMQHDGEEMLYNIDEYQAHTTLYEQIYIQELFDEYCSYEKGTFTAEECIVHMFSVMNKYNENISFQTKYIASHLQYLEKVVKSTFDLFNTNHNIRINLNTQNLIARYLYSQSYYHSAYQQVEVLYDKEMKGFAIFLRANFSKEMKVLESLSKVLEKNFDVHMLFGIQVMILLNLRYFHRSLASKKVAGIIICHGYSTASSIANTANTMIGTSVFDAIDMPLDCCVKQVIESVETYINEHYFIEKLIILVDMGSLASIGEVLKEYIHITIGVINNISTSLALDVGFMLKENEEVSVILEKACSKNVCNYKLFCKDTQEKAIIFTSESGTNTAARMRDLFKKSIPRSIDVKLVSCDYFQLKQEGGKIGIIGTYEILFIAGIFNPNFENVKFIGLGEIINFKAIHEIDNVLACYLNEEEIEVFNNNLLKNFTLLNVVEHVTILNPTRLLDMVEDAILQLQQMVEKKISAQTLIGLYVHICCFVERMVTRTPIETYMDINVFRVDQKQFIEYVQIAFENVMAHYSIEFPVSEIAYIYEYIKNDEQQQLEEGEEF